MLRPGRGGEDTEVMVRNLETRHFTNGKNTIMRIAMRIAEAGGAVQRSLGLSLIENLNRYPAMTEKIKKALTILVAKNKEWFGFVVTGLSHTEPEVRIECCHFVQDYDLDEFRDLVKERLIEAAKDSHPGVRIAATVALSHLDFEERETYTHRNADTDVPAELRIDVKDEWNKLKTEFIRKD